MEYKTRQREMVLNILSSNPELSLSAKEIKDKLGEEVSKATLYRTLDKLEEDHVLRKYFNELTSTYEYQYTNGNESCSNHLHLKCTQCGKLIHLHCAESTALISHISKHHNFFINQETTIIYGLCGDCSLIRRN